MITYLEFFLYSSESPTHQNYKIAVPEPTLIEPID